MSQMLMGWGSTAPTRARMLQVGGVDEARDALDQVDSRGAIARGLGRSYGSPAQNAGGLVLAMAGQGGTPRLDAAAQTVTAHAGISLDDLMKHLVPQGFFVPVTPGTRQVTLGGAIAADIHGKNHHVEGSLGNHIAGLRLFLADGSVKELSPEHERCPVLGDRRRDGTDRSDSRCDDPAAADRDEPDARRHRADHRPRRCAVRMAEGDHRHRYSVAWMDSSATGRRLGRSVLSSGDHAPLAALSGRAANDPLHFDPHTPLAAPRIPNGLLNRLSIHAFNELWYRKAPKRSHDHVSSISSFFHPLDGVRWWNRLYGPQGFVQYQVVIPFGEERVLRTVVERMAGFGDPSFLVVLKRFGAGNPGPLSFPMPGWTITVDIAAGRQGLSPLLTSLDHLVLDAGGRHYLAKDGHMTAAAMRRGYPRLDEWKAIRDKADPTGVWQSDLARRLELIS